jgi:Zn-dependent oligopeptidase
LGKDDLFTTNPLFWSLDGSNDFVPAFRHIKPEHFEPAINFALIEAREAVARIANNPETPTFANTIEPLDFAHTRLQYFFSILGHLSNVRRTPELETIGKKLDTLKAAYFDSLHFNTSLFKRIKTINEQKDTLYLPVEKSTLVDYIYHDFYMNGAGLSAPKKKQLYHINQTLAKLSADYDSLMMDYTESGKITVDSRAELIGLPRRLIADAAKLAAQSDQKGKWVFPGDDETWWEMVTKSQSRSLRKNLFETTFDTGLMLKVVRQILSLRHDRAQLLGFQSHLEYKLKGRMLKTKTEITDFLDDIRSHTNTALRRDNAMLRALAREDGIDKINNYDHYYYEERLRERELGLEDKQLKPYFKVDNVVGGAMGLANELFDLEFFHNGTLELWHDDVVAFDVKDKKTGQPVARLMLDLYARPEKISGGWCDCLVAHGLFEGKTAIPIIPIACNFKKSTTDEPSFTSVDNAKIFFHELGHAVQVMKTKTSYQTLSGFNNVPVDVVEMFSQIFENWAIEPEILDRYARHYRTGKRLPDEIKQKIQESSAFMGGSTMKFKLESTYLDLALHSRNLKKNSVEKFELDYLGKMFPGRSRKGGIFTPVFQHIVTFGYDAGYYSYLWAEALEADGYQMFRENGVLDKKTADKLSVFMANAGTMDARESYLAFRGRPPSPDALLERYNLRGSFNASAAARVPAPEQDNTPPVPVPARSRKPAP